MFVIVIHNIVKSPWYIKENMLLRILLTAVFHLFLHSDLHHACSNSKIQFCPHYRQHQTTVITGRDSKLLNHNRMETVNIYLDGLLKFH